MAKASDPRIMTRIGEALTEEGNIATASFHLPEHGCRARDYGYERSFKESDGQGKGTSVPQRLCLCFDPETWGSDGRKLSATLVEERESIGSHMASGVAPPDESLLRKPRRRHIVETDGDGTMTASWSESGKGIAKDRKRCGFFAVVCASMNAARHTIGWVLSKRGMRDMQEKPFMRMEGWQGAAGSAH